MMNNVTLVGRVGNDPKVEMNKSGRSYMRLRVCTEEFYKDRDGKKQKNATWHTVKVFDKAADSLGSFLRKGHLVSVEGRLSVWESDGEQGKRTHVDVEARRCRSLTPRDASPAAEHELDSLGTDGAYDA